MLCGYQPRCPPPPPHRPVAAAATAPPPPQPERPPPPRHRSCRRHHRRRITAATTTATAGRSSRGRASFTTRLRPPIRCCACIDSCLHLVAIKGDEAEAASFDDACGLRSIAANMSMSCASVTNKGRFPTYRDLLLNYLSFDCCRVLVSLLMDPSQKAEFFVGKPVGYCASTRR